MQVTTVGIDLAKNVFQLHGVNEFGKPVLKKQLRRLLRKAQARTLEALWSAVGALLDLFGAGECERYIRHCGYCQSG